MDSSLSLFRCLERLGTHALTFLRCILHVSTPSPKKELKHCIQSEQSIGQFDNVLDCHGKTAMVAIHIAEQWAWKEACIALQYGTLIGL
jgi:phosphopantetheinyl transferase (holo-ACP synthase)